MCVISAFEWLLMYTKSHAVTDEPHDASVKFDTYQNLQRHRAVLSATARLLLFNRLTDKTDDGDN